jgi:hypothetical protein
VTDSFNLRLNIPDKQPFEGKAIQKQKQLIWDLGCRDEEMIANLGKKQASSVINQLSKAQNRFRQEKGGRTAFLFGFVMTGTGLGMVYLGGEDYSGFGGALGTVGLLILLYGLGKWLVYNFLAPKQASE